MYTFDGFQFEYATFQEDGGPDIIVFFDTDHNFVRSTLSDHPMVDYYLNTLGLEIRVARPPYHKWDAVNEVWILDNVQFTPYLKSVLKDHRNTKFQPTVTFNGVTANNTPEERNLIIGIIAYLQAKGEQQTISWKQPNDVFAPATIADLQGLMLTGGQITENAFSTEKHILEQHAATPFTTIEAAIAAFDTYFDSL